MFPFAPQFSPMPRINPMAISSMNGAPGLMNPGAGASAPMAMNPDAGAASPQGGLMGFLGLNKQQGQALPLAMGLMGQGMQNLGGGQQPPPQAAPPAGPMNNPAAIQAAVQMMQQLRTQRGPGGMPQGARGIRRF